MTASSFGPPPGPRFDVAPTPTEVARFHDDGFLVVPRITTDEELAWLAGIFEHVFSPAYPRGPTSPQDRSGTRAGDAPVTLAQSFFPELAFPELLQTNYVRNARRFAAALLGADTSAVGSWGHMIRKPPGGRTTPWHQDLAYWQPELDYHALGVWLPLHEVAVERGAMQFVRGSHRRGLLPHRHDDAPQHNLLVCDAPFAAEDVVPCPLPAGGATIHHAQTLHFTAANTTDAPRLAYPIEFETTPTARTAPRAMPWTDAFRAAAGMPKPRRHLVLADGVARYIDV